jgi:hypothetical protein
MARAATNPVQTTLPWRTRAAAFYLALALALALAFFAPLCRHSFHRYDCRTFHASILNAQVH